MEEKKLYFVSDSYLVAYLLSDGFKYEKVEVYERDNGKKTVDFFFKNTKELHASINDYRENEFLLNYKDNLKKVRKNVNQALRGGTID